MIIEEDKKREDFEKTQRLNHDGIMDHSAGDDDDEFKDFANSLISNDSASISTSQNSAAGGGVKNENSLPNVVKAENTNVKPHLFHNGTAALATTRTTTATCSSVTHRNNQVVKITSIDAARNAGFKIGIYCFLCVVCIYNKCG